MARRLHPTFADYVTMAISPALVMVLVGSLLFFLLEVFYRGEFEGRLQYIFALFVFSAVLIARISIEEGAHRAALFAAPLAVATLVALARFVDYPGPLAASFSWLINLGLIGLVWWSAHQLTKDSAVLDDLKDPTGEGLLQTIGLDPSSNADAVRVAEGADVVPATTGGRDASPGWWARLRSVATRPHPHGFWVVYFSLAALPLFGLGQMLLPAGRAASRRYVFGLMILYVASALGLLLTTSFLGLRRYLRKRRLEMPPSMAATWIGVGGLLILAVLLFAALLPRPGAEVALSRIPAFAQSRDNLQSSRHAFGRDGVDDPNAESPRADDRSDGDAAGEPPTDRPTRSDQPQGETGTEGTNGSQSGDSGAEGPDGEPSESSAEPSRGGKPGRGQPPGQAGNRNDGQRTPQDEGTAGDNGRRAEQGGATDAQQATDASGSGEAADERPGDTAEGDIAANDSGQDAAEPHASQPTGSNSQPQGKPPNLVGAPADWLAGLSTMLGSLAKGLFYLAVAAALLIALWKYRSELFSAARSLLADLRDFWQSLFGRRRPAVGEVAGESAGAEPPSVRPFSSYADPFAAGPRGSYAPEELVRYSFEAFEAWAREHGCGRGPDQTPFELAARAGRVAPPLAREARDLAELYSHLAYAQGRLSSESIQPLKQLWERMRG